MKFEYEQAGAAWPPNVDRATTSAAFWHLPEGSFVQLAGITPRALLLLVLRLKIQKKTDDVGDGQFMFIHVERGTFFHQPTMGQCTTMVPGMKLAVLHRAGGIARLSWIAPAEVFSLMGAPLPSLFPPDVLARLPLSVDYTDMVKIAGGAFHLQTSVAFVVSTLMLRRVVAAGDF
jgi:hypothetical protein